MAQGDLGIRATAQRDTRAQGQGIRAFPRPGQRQACHAHERTPSETAPPPGEGRGKLVY